MSLIQVLCDLYDKNSDIVGKVQSKPTNSGNKEERSVLLPIGHTTALAHIEITLDEKGNLLEAEIIDVNDRTTIIPATEKSMSRTSGPVPHPLFDCLKYIAGDYEKFSIKSKEKKNKDEKSLFQMYIEGLDKWCKSPYAHPKVNGIYKYLSKGNVINDLVKLGLLKTDDKGKITDEKIAGNISQLDSFVRFKVVINYDVSPIELLNDEKGKYDSKVWTDRTVHESYIKYYKSMESDLDYCYITGEYTRVSELHSKKIRNEGDGAKLISSNDESNYTYRGRFLDKREAFAIGYEASQKAHNALKWIIRRQGYTKNDLCIVVWQSNLLDIPYPTQDTEEIVLLSFDDNSNESYNSNYNYAQKFNSAIDGFVSRMDTGSNMYIMALEAATPGRLSLTLFKELDSTEYLSNVRYWHNTCSWKHSKHTEKNKNIEFHGMISVKDIADSLYGTEQNGALKLNNNKLHAEVFRRVLPCIIERKKIPEDMVRLAVIRASNPLAYERYNWERILTLACSMVKKSRFENKKEDWSMALNPESTDRSYLYGRLLAIADAIEKQSFDSSDAGKETNAKRYMNTFSQRPFRTWRIIEERFQPYLNKLKPGSKIFYSKLIDEVHSKFNEDDFKSDRRLDGLYLLGYHNQLYFLNSKKQEE